jgi:hypothetical protein
MNIGFFGGFIAGVVALFIVPGVFGAYVTAGKATQQECEAKRPRTEQCVQRWVVDRGTK